MLAHGRRELVALAERCEVEDLPDVNGWLVDTWHMDAGDVDAAIEIYAAVLDGDATDPVLALLGDAKVDLTKLLTDAEHGKDDITRSDLTELTAAASLAAAPGCDVNLMHMPNVPKMSRRKSDSGVDIFVPVLKSGGETDDLHDHEHLTIASVKHTVGESSGGMRRKLAESLSTRELSTAYLATQLRVLNARLQQEGLPVASAARVYLFLRDFPHSDNIDLFAIGVADPDLKDDLIHHVQLLPNVEPGYRTFRMIFLPGLRTVHRRCP